MFQTFLKLQRFETRVAQNVEFFKNLFVNVYTLKVYTYKTSLLIKVQHFAS